MKRLLALPIMLITLALVACGNDWSVGPDDGGRGGSGMSQRYHYYYEVDCRYDAFGQPYDCSDMYSMSPSMSVDLRMQRFASMTSAPIMIRASTMWVMTTGIAIIILKGMIPAWSSMRMAPNSSILIVTRAELTTITEITTTTIKKGAYKGLFRLHLLSTAFCLLPTFSILCPTHE